MASASPGSGIRRSTSDFSLPEVPVELARLPRALSGYRIALLSDLHIGGLLGQRFVEHVVATTNALRPDLIAIAGDLVDGSVRRVGPQLRPLADLHARDGVFFVTGNHEYYSGVGAWLPYLRTLGVRVLGNERVEIGDRGASFDLAGVHDWQGRWWRGFGPDLGRALAGRDPERELVLLAHQPAQIEKAAEAGVGLQLSGHTHGGQIWPMTSVVALVQPYVHGLHRHGATTQIYVSRGVGFWGVPIRVGAPAEITRVVLVAA